MTRTWLSNWTLVALLGAVSVAAPGCAKDGERSTDAPEELDLPPEKKVADTNGPKKKDPADAKKAKQQEPKDVADEKVEAKKIDGEGGKPAVSHPQDRDPNQEKAKMTRSRKHSAKAKQLLRSNQGDKAVAEARRALREHEQNVEAMLVIAEVFYRQGKHELVQSVTGSILKVDAKVLSPEEKSQAYNLMGFAYLQAGKRVDAFRSFKSAAETDDKNASAWNNLGVQYMWRGDPKTAESCFSYAAELDPKFAEAHLNHGASLRANGKLTEAELAFNSAAKLRPDWAEVQFNLGVLYLDADQIGTFDEIAKLEACIKAFERYKSLVGQGKSSLERSTKQSGPTDAMGNELVSVAQADLYIKAANKAIESAERKAERDEKRKQREAKKAAEEAEEAKKAAEGEGEGEDAPKTDEPKADTPKEEPPKSEPPKTQPSKPKQPAKPQKPGAQKPGAQKPGAQKPKAQKPKPQKPGG